jgi:hypothetical protein
LLLNEHGAPPLRLPYEYTVEAPSRAGDLDEETDTVDFPLRRVAGESYLLRVRVDGAESALDSGPGGFSGPVVTP